MPFPSALTSPDYTKLRAGGHKSNQYLLLGSNTTVFAARVNQTTFTASFGQITFDTVTTGAYTDILEGMTVLISSSNDKRAAYFVGRMRADSSGVVSTSTILNVNETSATVADNDYIFVLRDYRLFHELGRYVNDTYYKDYARTFIALKPIIYGLQSTYAGVVSGSPVGFTVAFAASAVAATSSATISSYAWTLPSGTTVTAGATNTASVTVRFDASAAEYWVRLVVTDSGGRTQTRYISVFAIPADLSTTITLGASGATINGDIDNGWSASIDAFAGFTSVLDNTLAVILDVEYYGTTQTSLVSAVKFVGRIRVDNNATKTDERVSISKKAQLDIEGAAAQMTRITTPQITLRDSSAAAVWDEVTKLTVWRSVTYLLEHSTFHNLYSLSFDSTADTYYAYQLLAPQGNMLTAVNDLLKSINAGLEFAPTGEARAVRNLNFLSDAERNALVTVAAFEMQDNIGFPTLAHQHVDTVGVVEASGGTYFRNGGILPNMVIPLLSIAPGVAQGNAEGVSPLPSQILTANIAATTAQTELNTRAGNQYAYANGNDELTVDLRAGYNWIVPSRYQFYTWAIDASDSTFGRAYDTSNRWWCKSVSVRHNNDTGTKEVNVVFVLETSGADAGATGQTVDIPAPGTTDPILPYIPPIPAYPYFPPPPDIFLPTSPTIPYLPPYTAPPNTSNNIPVDGNAVVYWTASRVWYCTNFLGLNTPVEITPPNSMGTIQNVALVGQRIYVISTDGTNSMLHSAPNAFMGSPDYTDTLMSGLYLTVRPTSTEGALYAIGYTTDSETPFSLDVSTYNGGNGQNIGFPVNSGETITITATGTVNYDISNTTTAAGVGSPLVGGVLASAPVGRLLARIGTSGTWENIGASGTFTASSSGDLYLIMNDVDNPTDYADNSGSYTITLNLYWDFRVAEHGATIGNWIDPDAGSLGYPGSWVSSTGFRSQWIENYFSTYDGEFMRVVFPNDIRLASIQQITVYSLGAGASNILYSGALTGNPMSPLIDTPAGTFSGSGGSRGTAATVFSWNSSVDARGRSWVTTYLTGDGNHNDMQGVEFQFASTTRTLVTCYSDDYGATFAAPESVDITGGAGIDTIKIGVPVLVGGDGQVRIATSAGGAYSDYGSATPAGSTPTAIYIPRYQFGSTSAGNTGSTPQFLVASSTLTAGNAALWKVTSSGATYTDITPQVGGDYGRAIGANCIWMPWWSGSVIFAVLDFGGTPRLVYSTDSGTSWTDKGVLDDDAVSVMGRRGDKTMQSLFITNGSPAYSRNRGASIVSKSFPDDAATHPVLGVIPYG